MQGGMALEYNPHSKLFLCGCFHIAARFKKKTDYKLDEALAQRGREFPLQGASAFTHPRSPTRLISGISARSTLANNNLRALRIQGRALD
jgi:hypothetical protein